MHISRQESVSCIHKNGCFPLQPLAKVISLEGILIHSTFSTLLDIL